MNTCVVKAEDKGVIKSSARRLCGVFSFYFLGFRVASLLQDRLIVERNSCVLPHLVTQLYL